MKLLEQLAQLALIKKGGYVMKKNCNLSLETKLELIRTNYLARVEKRNVLVNFDPKGENCEEPREGQRTVRDFKSITDEELNIIIKDFQLFSIHFATELRNTFRNIYFKRKQKKELYRSLKKNDVLEELNNFDGIKITDKRTRTQYIFNEESVLEREGE